MSYPTISRRTVEKCEGGHGPEEWIIRIYFSDGILSCSQCSHFRLRREAVERLHEIEREGAIKAEGFAAMDEVTR